MSMCYVTYLGSSAFETPTFAVQAPLSKTNTSFVTAILHCYFIGRNNNKTASATSHHPTYHNARTHTHTKLICAHHHRQTRNCCILYHRLLFVTDHTYTWWPISQIKQIMAVAGHLRLVHRTFVNESPVDIYIHTHTHKHIHMIS